MERTVWIGDVPAGVDSDLIIAGLYQFTSNVQNFFLQPPPPGSIRTWATAQLGSFSDAQAAIRAGKMDLDGCILVIRPKYAPTGSSAPRPYVPPTVASASQPLLNLPRPQPTHLPLAMHPPSPSASSHSSSAPPRYPPGFCNHVFWDYDNLPIPHKTLVTPFIRNMERIFGPIHRPILAVGNARSVSDDVTHQLTLENVELQHLAGVKEMADRALESKIQSFLANAKPNEHIVLITADGDFSRPLAGKKWELRVVIIKTSLRPVNPALLDRAFEQNRFDMEMLLSPAANHIAPLPVPVFGEFEQQQPQPPQPIAPQPQPTFSHPQPRHPSGDQRQRSPSMGQSGDRSRSRSKVRFEDADQLQMDIDSAQSLPEESPHRGRSPARRGSAPAPPRQSSADRRLSVACKAQLRAALQHLKQEGYEPNEHLVRAVIKRQNFERFSATWGEKEKDPKWKEMLAKIEADPEFLVEPSTRPPHDQKLIFFSAEPKWDFIHVDSRENPYGDELWSALVRFLCEYPDERLSPNSYVGAATLIKTKGPRVLACLKEAQLNQMVRLAHKLPEFRVLAKDANNLRIEKQRALELNELYNPNPNPQPSAFSSLPPPRVELLPEVSPSGSQALSLGKLPQEKSGGEREEASDVSLDELPPRSPVGDGSNVHLELAPPSQLLPQQSDQQPPPEALVLPANPQQNAPPLDSRLLPTSSERVLEMMATVHISQQEAEYFLDMMGGDVKAAIEMFHSVNA